MARKRTQKQISERYKDNLANYKRLYSWRRAGVAVTLLTLAAGGFAIWYYYKKAPEKFFNPGPVSSHHQHITPAMIGSATADELNRSGASTNCDACHDKSLITGGINSKKFVQVLRESFGKGASADRITQIDNRCEACHSKLSKQTHTFHEFNAVQFHCSECHQEHRGPGPMKLVATSQCTACHGNSQVMQVAARQKPPEGWTPLQRHPQPPQRVVFTQLGRPPEGYTKTFSTFWDDHPEFGINVARKTDSKMVRDPDSFAAADGIHDILRFNHSRHFSSDIPAVDKTGRKLDCNYCHQVEIEGRFMKRISFEANCQVCHQLQFDLNNPDLTLPHGDATAVLGFLRSVTTHYEDLARRKGITDPKKIRTFVQDQRRGLATQYTSDEQLFRSVFFEADPYKIRPGMNRPRAANFAGCAYCHDVKPAAVGAPQVTRPILVDRWMLLSDFDHSKHVAIRGADCETCHQTARSSTRSADILLPVKDSCLKCHSPHAEPEFRTAAECITCHKYHAKAILTTRSADSSRSSLKQMLLAREH